ncbi:unnamed protein product [Leptosia nina]|uniref:Ubiquitin-like-conjugating enzyme ATG10 n=1 Tax=Leptosia nina TaxID=320188 RepID=A0AAV1JKZ7_9NEOP
MIDHEFISLEAFISSAESFVKISDRIHDDWKFHRDYDKQSYYIKKDTFIKHADELFKAEFNIFYNLSYGVPSFSFNIWESSGSLLSLEDIRRMSLIEIKEKDFYSVITQQEHPVFGRPYFVMHPCQTLELLASLPDSKNIIVTFLSLITPLINLKLPLEYGLL